LKAAALYRKRLACAAERYERARIGYLSFVNTAKPVRNPPGIGGAKSTSEQNLLAIQSTFTDKGIMTFRTHKITGAKAQVLIALGIPGGF